MAQADEIIHQQIRLQIMSALNALDAGEAYEFIRLKAIVRATDGNLATHLATLEDAKYITVKKDFNGRKPRTRVYLTRAGQKAFAEHVAFLRQIIGEEE